MIEILRWLGVLLLTAVRERRDLAFENLALTTAESAEEKECSAETEEERPIVLGGAFSNLGPWRRPLQLVKAETVVGWQRKGFRLYWGQDFAAET